MISLELKIGEHLEKIDFGVTNLGQGEIFLGHDWLKLHNPSIDWRESLIEFDRCPSYCRPHIHLRQNEFELEDEDLSWTSDMTLDLENGDRLLLIDPTPAIQIHASTNIAMELAIKANEKKDKNPGKKQSRSIYTTSP